MFHHVSGLGVIDDLFVAYKYISGVPGDKTNAKAWGYARKKELRSQQRRTYISHE
jgi:hypothetical protein